MLEELYIDFWIIAIFTAVAGVINFFIEFNAWEKEQELKRAKRLYNVINMEKYRKDKNVRRIYR